VRTRGHCVAVWSLAVAPVLIVVTTFASACNPCGNFEGVAASSRAFVGFLPLVLPGIAARAGRSRAALAMLAAYVGPVSAVTPALVTGARTVLEPLGLGSTPGFVVYSIPFAITSAAASLGLRG
jgi:hypothetical protein